MTSDFSIDVNSLLHKQMFQEIQSKPERSQYGNSPSSDPEELRSLSQIIVDERLNYRSSIFHRKVVEQDPLFIEVKKKRFNYKGIESYLVSMTDVTNHIKYIEAQHNIDLLNSL